MKILNIFDCRRIEIGQGSNSRSFVRMGLVGEPLDIFIQHPVWLGEYALPEFFLDNCTFRFEICFINRQIRHPFRFRPDKRFEIVRRDHLIVIRKIVPRRGVVKTADVLSQTVHHFGFHVLCRFEHDVFEKMSKTVSTWRVVFRADIVPEMYCNRRAGIVLERNDL